MLFEEISAPKADKQKKKRKKQILESLFSSSIKKNYPNIIGHKIHNNPLAHQRTHCDFEIFNKEGMVFFVEAKEIQLKEGKARFPFSRLGQKNMLMYYDKFSKYTSSFLLLLYRGDNMEESFCFLIPINDFSEYQETAILKSISLEECKKYFNMYLLKYNEIFDMSRFYKNKTFIY